MTVVENIILTLAKSPMDVGELSSSLKSTESYIKNTLKTLSDMGLVEKINGNYALTEIGSQRAKMIVPVVKKKRTSSFDIEQAIPNREVFDIITLTENISRMKGREVKLYDVRSTVKDLREKREVIRVSPEDQAKTYRVMYLKGLEKDEWYCATCGQIMAANEFDALNWGIAGAKCNHCINSEKKTPVKEVGSMMSGIKLLPAPHKVVKEMVSPDVSELVNKIDTLSNQMGELIQISKDQYNLFLRLVDSKKQ